MSLNPQNELKLRRLWAGSEEVGISQSEIGKFLEKVNQVGHHWEWCASTRDGGMNGQFIYRDLDGRRKTQLSHRIVFQLREQRRITRGSEVYKTCENTLCVNPRHLAERRGMRQPRGPRT
jgi:hypothetical protein